MRSGSLRRSFAALGATAALVGGALAATPAEGAGTHTVTVTLNPAREGWTVNLSCDNNISDIGSTNAAGQAFFPNIPDGTPCSAQAYPYTLTDSIIVFEGGGFTESASASSSTAPNLTAPVQPTNSTSFRCTGPTSVSGTAAVGQQLGVVPPSFVNGSEDVAKRKVLWLRLTFRNGHLVSRIVQGVNVADPSHYTVTEADLGWQMIPILFATKAGGTDMAYCDWNPSGVVGRLGTPTSGRPGIAGRAEVGKKLTANPHAVPPGTTVTYQWFRSVGGNGHKARLVKIRRAHGKRYKVRGADQGHKVFVAVTYSRSPYNPTTVLSRGKKVH